MIQPSCAHQALIIPEILINIFECLQHDAPAMRAAIRVSKHWFTCGTDVLWRRAPSEALAALPEHCRQLYASKITSLAFSGDQESDYHDLFRNLELTSLKEVSIDAYRPESGDLQLRQYLQPPLESFSFYGGDLDAQLLQRLQTTCWRLKKILIDSPGSQITPDVFLGFISACKHLEHIDLLHGTEHLLTDELLVHLAQRPNLVSLGIGRELSAPLIKRISDQVSDPFPALQSLDVSISSSAVPSLVATCPGITSLGLDVSDSQADVIGHLSSIRGLRRLDLSFGKPKELSREELLSVKKLPKLEALIIGPAENEDAGDMTAFRDGFSDADFDDLVSRLGLLRRLNLMIQCDLSSAVIMSLSKHCPLLEECTLPQVLDIRAIEPRAHRDTVLRKLQMLDLGGLRPVDGDMNREQNTPEEVVSMMKCWFPKLEEVYVSSDDEFSESIVNAFTEES